MVFTYYSTHRTSSPVPDNTPVVTLSNPLPTPLPDPDAPPTPAPGTNSDDPNAYVEKLFCNWVKNSRLAFLNDHLSTYRERVNQGKSQANNYVHKVVKDYFKRYHWKLKVSDEPSENNPLQMESDESLSPVELKQKSQKIIAMQKAIKSWLDYCAKSSKKLLVRNGKPENNEWIRLLSQLSGVRRNKPKALQAHQRWSKDHFGTKIKAHFLRKWRSAGLPSKKMAAFRDKITCKHFKKLSKEEQTDWKDKAQAEGKAAIQEWKDRLEAAPSTSPIDRQVALDNLASFSGPILAGMSATLGMHVSLLVGGPEPRKQGKITVVSMHEGVDLGPIPCNWQTRDQKKFKMVTKYFQKYLSQAYTKQDCDSRRLPDDLDNMFTISQAGDQSNAKEDQTGGEMNKPTAAKFRSRRVKPRQQGTKPGRASRQKPSKPSEMDESSSESSSPTSGSSSSSSSSASLISTDSKGETHWELPFAPKKMNYGRSQATQRKGKPSCANGNHFTSEVSDQTSEVPDRASTVPDRSSEAAVFEMLEDTEEFDELAENTNTPVNEAEITIDPSPDGNLSLNLPALPLSPPWFRNPFQQLMNPALASPQLIQLFEKLVCLEDASSFANEKAALGCEHRPIEVHWWISRGRKGKPTIPDLDAFMSQWWSWWLTLQPEWRKCQAPTLMARAVLPRTDDGNWDTLNKPGANGMLSIVATLKWWADGANGKGHEESCWEDAADDVTWVLDRLTAIRSMSKSKSSGGNKKQGCSDTQVKVSSSKRTRNRQ
ncbi:uncharacterized protein F5891DRAFT_938521 [Suillus fuscotomentosus]|uniref:Uncharacterized protein n=1 Tax=Suillus fuscotomentosus TaxID=1912939 RepID=A0AAD4EK49_9AGAM|nr:uncharacterized protein F5891DRAFT_938521 [Suillus fuscotomentosus]KAG1907610.1 hypothetical protein F5891DRAFT_938521 [Suillus fuscotomentosus]